MVYKRYKGRRLKPRDREWNKGKWVVEFMLKVIEYSKQFRTRGTKRRLKQSSARSKVR